MKSRVGKQETGPEKRANETKPKLEMNQKELSEGIKLLFLTICFSSSTEQSVEKDITPGTNPLPFFLFVYLATPS